MPTEDPCQAKAYLAPGDWSQEEKVSESFIGLEALRAAAQANN